MGGYVGKTTLDAISKYTGDYRASDKAAFVYGLPRTQRDGDVINMEPKMNKNQINDVAIKNSRAAGIAGDALPFYTKDKPEAVRAYYDAINSQARMGMPEDKDIEKATMTKEKWELLDADLSKGDLYRDEDRAYDAYEHARNSGFYAREIPEFIKSDMALLKAYRDGAVDAQNDMAIGEMEDAQEREFGAEGGRKTWSLDRNLYHQIRAEIDAVIKNYQEKPAEEATFYLYADHVNGCWVIDDNDVELEVDTCQSMEDVRRYLKNMGDGEGEIFERVLQIPASLLDAIDEEYGISRPGMKP